MYTFTSKFLLSALPLCLCLACADHGDTSQEFREALADTSAENEQHAAACARSGSSQDIADEMDRHDAHMPLLFGRMSDGFSGMGHCFAGDPNTMRDMMSGLRAKDESHRERMHAATNLPDAITECRTYTDATRDDLGQMSGMMRSTHMGCM